MICPVKNPSDTKHFIKPSETRKYVIEKNMTFEDLKKELPAVMLTM